MLLDYQRIEAQIKQEIKLNDKQIKQIDDIRSTTEKIEKLSPSGIYYKRNDFQTEIKYKKEPSEVEEKVTSFSTETDSEKYGKVGSNNKRSPHNTYEKIPLPPKMATYDGKTNWRPYFLQFTHIANRYKWSPEQKLDKLIEWLRDKALKFYSFKTKTVQENYDQLCKKINDRFGRKDMPHILRRQLQDIKQEQEESLEEFAERTQEMAIDGHPDTPEAFVEIVTIDAFLKGCTDKKAALAAMEKNPNTSDEAMQCVKNAVTNREQGKLTLKE